MGYIAAVSWPFSTSRGIGKAKIAADHIREDAGYNGEWVTTVGTDFYGRPIRFKRDNRPVFATRAEAVKWGKKNRIKY